MNCYFNTYFDVIMENFPIVYTVGFFSSGSGLPFFREVSTRVPINEGEKYFDLFDILEEIKGRISAREGWID